ncbi:MAG: DHH family phosphoesterase [Candidatus Magasanikbacteria bacterium]
MKDFAGQLNKILENKKNILITFPKTDKGDAISSAVALLIFLEKLGKRVDIVCENIEVPQQLNFIKKTKLIKSALNYLQKFVITIDTKKTGLHELSYDHKDNKLKIFITPKQNYLSRDNISTAQSDFKYDIIFTLGTRDLEQLGNIFHDNTEFFYKCPIINIDHSANNSHFGHVNIVDITAVSTAEILYDLLENWQAENISEEIATALLTGMIVNTHSFKTGNIKPQTLHFASKLMHLGANRDYIVQNLYRTRSLSTLKLWGQALSHLQYDKSIGLVWTIITRDDLIRSGANSNDLHEIIEELISNSPEAKLILLLHEDNMIDEKPVVKIILDTNKDFNASELLKPYQSSGDKKQAVATIVGKTLKQVEEEVVEHIRKKVAN